MNQGTVHLYILNANPVYYFSFLLNVIEHIPKSYTEICVFI